MTLLIFITQFTQFFKLKFLVKGFVIDCNLKMYYWMALKLYIYIYLYIFYSIQTSQNLKFPIYCYPIFRGFEFLTSVFCLKFLKVFLTCKCISGLPKLNFGKTANLFSSFARFNSGIQSQTNTHKNYDTYNIKV